MRMLFSSSIPLAVINTWTSSMPAHKAAFTHLTKLRLCVKCPPPPGAENATFLQLNEKFQKQIVSSMCKNDQSVFPSKKDKPAKNPDHVPDTTTLDEFSRQCWDDVLHFMVGSTSRPPSPFLVHLLVDAELMTLEGEDRLRISNKGFKFLLKDVHTQIWTLLLKYIDTADTRRVDQQGDAAKYAVRKELLSFLLRTSFLTFGQGYPVKELTPTQKMVMSDLKEFGLIYQRKESSLKFYPTRLAISLCSGKSTVLPPGHETSKAEQEGYIILESNYRLYAYTSSTLKIALLSLFVRMQYRLPSFAMGTITRESVRTALLNGISADQIISFIQQNVHTQAKKNSVAVPETVVDQIRLWEAERNRVTYQKGILYDGFPTNNDMYKEVVQYAKDLSVYLWSNDEKRFLMAAESGHDSIKTFIKKKWG